MELKAEEISQIIKEQITDYDKKVELSETGVVLSVGDGIARVYGLDNVQAGEMVEFPGGIMGMALNLERDSVGAVILGDYKGLAEGQSCRCTGRILEVPVGPELQGREGAVFGHTGFHFYGHGVPGFGGHKIFFPGKRHSHRPPCLA